MVVANGYIYVGDQNSDQIQYFSLLGDFIGKWGSSGAGDNQFSYIRDLATDSNGNIYVLDSGNSRVAVFDEDGTFVRKQTITSSYTMSSITVGTGNILYTYCTSHPNAEIQVSEAGVLQTTLALTAGLKIGNIRYTTVNGHFIIGGSAAGLVYIELDLSSGYAIDSYYFITEDDLKPHLLANSRSDMNIDISDRASFKEVKKDFEKKYIRTLLEKYNWNISKAAKRLGMQQPNLSRKMKELEINRD